MPTHLRKTQPPRVMVLIVLWVAQGTIPLDTTLCDKQTLSGVFQELGSAGPSCDAELLVAGRGG